MSSVKPELYNVSQLPVEEDQATATGNMHKKFGKVWPRRTRFCWSRRYRSLRTDLRSSRVESRGKPSRGLGDFVPRRWSILTSVKHCFVHNLQLYVFSGSHVTPKLIFCSSMSLVGLNPSNSPDKSSSAVHVGQKHRRKYRGDRRGLDDWSPTFELEPISYRSPTIFGSRELDKCSIVGFVAHVMI